MPKITREPIVLLPHRRLSGLFRSNGSYTADIKLDCGKRVRRSLGVDRDRAMELFDELLLYIEGEREQRENPLVVDFLDREFLQSQSELKAYGFARHRVGAVTRFLQSTHPGLRLREVAKRHGDELVAHYAGLSPKTRNENLKKLRQAMTLAVDLGVLDHNPLRGCKLLRVDNRRMQFCTMPEFCNLATFASRNCRSHDVATIVQVLGLTGLRPSNVLALEAGEVVGDRIRIHPSKMKNGRWGMMPISRHVQRLLGEAPLDGRWYFPSSVTGRPRTHIRRHWAAAREAAGVPWMTVYDLRHFFASQLAKQGVTEQQIGSLLCHVGTSVTSRYVHQDVEDLRPHVEHLSRAFQTSRDREA